MKKLPSSIMLLAFVFSILIYGFKWISLILLLGFLLFFEESKKDNEEFRKLRKQKLMTEINKNLAAARTERTVYLLNCRLLGINPDGKKNY
jgi:hypothetical protein